MTTLSGLSENCKSHSRVLGSESGKEIRCECISAVSGAELSLGSLASKNERRQTDARGSCSPKVLLYKKVPEDTLAHSGSGRQICP